MQGCQKVCGLPEEVSDGRRFYLNPIYSTKPQIDSSEGLIIIRVSIYRLFIEQESHKKTKK